MTKQQFSQAWTLAQSPQDLNVDEDVLFGCGLPDFQPAYCTIEQVAKLLRWQCFYIFGGGFDAEELNNMGKIARRKFLIV